MEEVRDRTRLTRRRALLAALLLSVLVLLLLLPRSPLALDFVFGQVQWRLAENGLDVSHGGLSGNIFSHLTARDARITGPGIDVRVEELTLSFDLLGLLGGRLPLSLAAETVRGEVTPEDIVLPGGFSGPVPEIRAAQLTDLALSVGGEPLIYPGFAVTDLELTSETGQGSFRASVDTADGHARISGTVDLNSFDVIAEVHHADATFGNYWWPWITGGHATGVFRLTDGVPEFDAQIIDGSIDFIHAPVSGISGDVRMRDLVITGEIAGTGLGGTVTGTTEVDIGAERWGATLDVDAAIEEAVHWLGRNIRLDLDFIPGTGRLQADVSMGGWRQASVTGTASGSGTAGGLPVVVSGTFGLDTDQVLSVDIDGRLAGGALAVGVVNSRAGSRLDVELDGMVLLPDGAPGLLTGGNATVFFPGPEGGPVPPSRADLHITGDSPLPLNIDVTGTATDPLFWQLELAGSVTGSAALDFTAVTADGRLIAPQLEIAGFPWPVRAEAVLDDAPLRFPLPFTLSAASGPLELGPLEATFAPETGGIALAAPGISFRTAGDSLALQLQDPPLELTLPGIPAPLPLDISGRIGHSGSGLLVDIEAAMAEVELSVAGDSDRLDLNLFTAGEQMAGTIDLTSQQWHAAGGVDAVVIADLLSLPVSGPFRGEVSGQGLTVTQSSLGGAVNVAGQELAVQLAADGSLSGQLAALGHDWELNGSLLPQPQLTAVSDMGSLTFADGTLSGGGQLDVPLLSSAQPWSLTADMGSGQASLTVGEPGAGVEVTGDWRDSLSLSGSFPAALVQPLLAGSVSVSGSVQLTPEVTGSADFTWQDVTGSISVAGSSLTGSASGPGLSALFDMDDGLAVTLDAFVPQPYVQVQLPEFAASGVIAGPTDSLRVDVEADAAGISVAAQGSTVNGLDVSGGALDGLLSAEGRLNLNPLDLSGTVAFRGVEHALFNLPPVTVQLRMEGGSPVLSGDGVYASFQDGEVQASGRLTAHILGEPHQLDIDFPALVLSGPVAQADATFSDGTLQAHVQLTAEAAGTQLTAAAQVQGSLSDVSLQGNVRAGDDGTRLLSFSGVASADGLHLESDLASLALDLIPGFEGSGLSLAGNATFELPGWSQPGLQLAGNLSGPGTDVGIAGSLAGVTADGSLLGERLSVAYAGDQVGATWGEAEVQLTLADGEVHGALRAGEGSPVGEASGEFHVSGDGTTQLDLTLFGVNAVLNGPLLPAPQLSGHLSVPYLAGDVSLEVTGQGLVARWQDVTLAADTGLNVSLSGSHAAEDWQASGTLGWHPGTGFSGSLSAAAGVLDRTFTAEATADGEGNLVIAGSLPGGRAPLAAVAAQVDPAGGVSGRVVIALQPADLFPAYSGESLALSSTLNLSGNVVDPAVSGTVAIAGPAEAAGTVTASPGSIALQLAGPHLRAEAAGTPAEWSGSVELTGLPLDGFTDLLPGAVAAGTATVSASPGWPPSARIEDLSIRQGETLISGSVHWDGALQADLQATVHLAGVNAGVPLQGVATGDLQVGDGLAGSLRLSGLQVAGTETLSGTADISGTVARPVISVDLTGPRGGNARLEARLHSGDFRLDSDLQVAGISTAFSLASTAGFLEASGSVTTAQGGFSVSSVRGQVIDLRGDGIFSTMTAAVDVQEGHVSLAGSLAGLGDFIDGGLDLSARLGGPGVNVAGRITGLRILDEELGDVGITTAQSGIVISGPDLEAQVSFAGAWALSRLELEPLPGLRVVGSGSGSGLAGSLDLVASGALLGEPVNLTLRAALSADVLTVSGRGSALQGALGLDAVLRGGNWSGTTVIESAIWGGLELDAEGAVFGSTFAPRLELQTMAEGAGVEVTGSVHLSAAEARFWQTASGSALTAPVSVSGEAWPNPRLLVSAEPGQVFELRSADPAGPPLQQPLIATGSISVPLQDFTLQLQALAEGGAGVDIAWLGLPGVAFRGELDLASLASQLEQVADGVTLRGQDQTRGQLTLDLAAGQISLEQVGFSNPWLDAELTGNLRLSGSARISGTLVPGSELAGWLPGLAGLEPLTVAVIMEDGIIRAVSDSSVSGLEALFSTASMRGSLSLWLEGLNLNLAYAPDTGVSGRIDADGLELLAIGQDNARLHADVSLQQGRATGSAELTLGSGRLNVDADWGLAGLLPAWLVPEGDRRGSLDVRMGAFDLSGIPGVAQAAPGMSGGLTGVLQVRNEVVAGSVVSAGLRAGGQPVQFEAIISGSPSRISVGASLAGSPLTLTIAGGQVEGLLEMRRFPVHRLAEAIAGPLDVIAEATGVMRFLVPWDDPAAAEIRVATEHVRLERSGVVTTGNLNFGLAEGVFEISDAEFSGAGEWTGSGVLRQDLLDFSLVATDADFGPMLGLIPVLSDIGAEARGSFALHASGDAANPVISFRTGQLALEMAGVTYELRDLDLNITGDQLTVAADLLATDPVQGSLRIEGGSRLSLVPLTLPDARISLAGSLVVPGIGPVTGVSGTIHSSPGGEQLLVDISGNMGQPLQVSGSLLPFDITVTGQDLRPATPVLVVADAVIDADLRLRAEDGLVVSGLLNLDEGQLHLGQAGDGPGMGGLGNQVIFEDLVVTVPSRLRLAESFGTAELTGRIAIAGTLAEPRLSGRADTIRGRFTFAGRDFDLREAYAVFDPQRGLYPELHLTAVTTFDRNRILPPGSTLSVIGPTDSSLAEVVLSFNGYLEPDGAAGFRLSADPVLSSNVTVQETREDGVATGVRQLSEAELLSLVALGRVEFETLLAGQAGLAAAVAQGAIDTAVDLFILAELQYALTEALGIELVEISSTALSGILTGGETDQFGVSLRFGGYLSDDVFATYRLSAFDDPQGLYSFSNEVGIRYLLGPVQLELAGRLSLPDEADRPPVAELSLGVRYDLSPSSTLEAGFDLSGERTNFRISFAWRW